MVGGKKKIVAYFLNLQIELQAVPVWLLRQQSLREQATPKPCHCQHWASAPSVWSLQAQKDNSNQPSTNLFILWQIIRICECDN